MSLLDVQPSQTLDFKRPFTKGVVKSLLTLRHLGSESNTNIVFKIKTTAPKQYCVRPNAGIIGPGEIREIQVLMQSQKEEFPLDYKPKDKFLIQSVHVKAEFSPDASGDIWQEAEKFTLGDPTYQKVRVAFIEQAPELDDPSTLPRAKVELDPTPQTVPDTIEVSEVVTTTVSEARVIKNDKVEANVGTITDSILITDNNENVALKEEIKRLQLLCDKYQRDLMTSRAELRQRNIISNPPAEAEHRIKVNNGDPKTEEKYSLVIVILAAVISFLFGVILF